MSCLAFMSGSHTSFRDDPGMLAEPQPDATADSAAKLKATGYGVKRKMPATTTSSSRDDRDEASGRDLPHELS